MADHDKKQINPVEKKQQHRPAEHTRSGRYFTPAVDIYENDKDIVLMADIPGVHTDDLSIDLRDDVLTLDAEVKAWECEGEKAVFQEFETGGFYRQFTLSELVDQSRIQARLKEGVLELILPKVEKAIPRKIEITAG